MPATIVLLHFDELDGIAPSDAMGNLDDLSVEPGIVEPTIVDAWTGRGRRFLQSATSGLLAPDISGNGTMLPRGASIQALVTIELATATGPMTLIARGINDGSVSERYAYGLEFEQQAANPGYVEMRWFRQDGAGVIKTLPPGVFRHAGDTTEIMITATHRWEAIDRCVVRYYVDKRMIAELVFADGSISGGVTGTTSIGARKAAGVWGRHFNGTIDELQVLDYELSPEEVEQTWNRLTIHQPAGAAMFRGLAPSGVWWFENPSNAIGRRAKVVSEALGLPIAAAEEIRATFLPDKCPASLIPRWEKLYDIVPKSHDSLDLRRARVVARAAADEGFSIPALQQAFSGLFSLEPDEIEILEYSNEIRDSFNTLEGERWTQGDVGTWSIAAGELQLLIASGTPAPLSPVPAVCHLWTPIDRGDDVTATFETTAFVQGKLVSYAGLPSGSFVGMCLHDRVGRRTIWFGVYNDGVSIQIGYREVLPGAPGAFIPLDPIAAGPIWLRIKVAPATGFVSGPTDTITLYWSTSGPSSGFSFTPFSTDPVYNLAGFGAYTTSTPGVNVVAKFDDFALWAPQGLVPFTWYAYRDPALAGVPDLIGAHALARRVSPAHMNASVCASKSLICGHAIYGQVGRGPMGGGL